MKAIVIFRNLRIMIFDMRVIFIDCMPGGLHAANAAKLWRNRFAKYERQNEILISNCHRMLACPICVGELVGEAFSRHGYFWYQASLKEDNAIDDEADYYWY